MQATIHKILEKYPSARASTKFGGPHEVQYLFKNLREEFSNLKTIKDNSNLIVKSSYGKGNWAAVPWIAILDTRQTDTTQNGTYIVLLFREDGKGVHLKLAQGVTVITRDLGTVAGSKELARRAAEIRDLFPDMENTNFDLTGDSRLETENKLARLYEASTIFSKYWDKENIPDDSSIESDLGVLINCYQSYIEGQLLKTYASPTEIIEEGQLIAEQYSIKNVIDDGCFLDPSAIDMYLDRLRVKKNLILQGPPGTGKTWLAKRLAYALIGQKDIQRVRSVQFHPNLSYEDFIRGFRPSSEGKLSLMDGAFMEAIENAKKTSLPYVVVVEEINRGNPAQIFGEMLTLLEADKRYPDEALELSYKRSSDERVFIPSNLYVIGTMNIADRSLALVDMALRRRFAFIELEPSFNQTWLKWLTDRNGIPEKIALAIQQGLNELNEVISNDASLGPQFKIGHSYATPPIDGINGNPKEWFIQVIETEIGPLLEEYWFDAPEKAKAAKERLASRL